MAAKRKRSTKKKATRRKGVSGASTSRCKEVTINGTRRKLCWNRRGRIKSNVAVGGRSKKKARR